MGGGTEAFPDLGRHCEQDSCHQLDPLPFKCDGCHKVFCLKHRSYIDHNCKKAEHHSRVVVVCKVCSIAIEKKEGKEDEDILAKHVKSGDCDATKKYKPKCPVKRCKETLTFSNTSTCKTCNQKVCLKHRFPDEHICTKPNRGESRFLLALASRTGKDCRGANKKVASPRSVYSC